MKTCRVCKKPFPVESYRWDNKAKGKRKGACNDCENARMREDRAKHKAKRQEGDRKRYRGDPGKVARQNMALYYGLAPAQIERVFEQTHCQLCEEPRGDRRFYVDHCHTTGQNRGVICNRCNLALGHMRDSAPLARRMADYIERGGFGFFGDNQNG